MRAAVVYESMFGNTGRIAEAVGTGLAARAEVTVVEVGAAPVDLLADVDLLVVGGPTHAFSMSRTSTRRDAATKTDRPLESTGTGIREWIGRLPGDVGQVRFAAFDTKVAKPNLPGSAAKSADKQLRKHHLTRVAGPTTFRVDGMTGPLLDGELDRARAWGIEVALAASRLAVGQARTS